MTSTQRRECMKLLHRAQAGDEAACDSLVRQLSEYFSYMIRRYRASDPAYDTDDMVADFQLGIWQAIRRVDGRGDPLYHLAWRGQMAVRAMLAMVKARRVGTEAEQRDIGQPVSLGTIPEGFDLEDRHPESNPAVLVANRLGAQQQLRELLQNCQLTPTHRDVIGWMLDDPAIDEKGANLRLARHLGVTPQAASASRRRAMEILSGQSHASVTVFTCAACGRELKSRGALTQHQRGQSGHKPCPALT